MASGLLLLPYQGRLEKIECSWFLLIRHIFPQVLIVPLPVCTRVEGLKSLCDVVPLSSSSLLLLLESHHIQPIHHHVPAIHHRFVLTEVLAVLPLLFISFGNWLPLERMFS